MNRTQSGHTWCLSSPDAGTGDGLALASRPGANACMLCRHTCHPSACRVGCKGGCGPGFGWRTQGSRRCCASMCKATAFAATLAGTNQEGGLCAAACTQLLCVVGNAVAGPGLCQPITAATRCTHSFAFDGLPAFQSCSETAPLLASRTLNVSPSDGLDSRPV